MARPRKFRKAIGAPFFRHIGNSETPGSTAVTVLSKNEDGVLMAQGTTVPSDAEAGYAKGCLFIDTNASVGSVLHVNEGDESSCDFNVVESAASVVTAVTAGEGLVGGGTEGSVTLDVAIPVYNDTGGNLTAGTLVNLSGFDTTNGITITKADADSNVPANAVVKDDIADTTTGSVYPIAQVDGLATNGQNIGDLVYLDTTTAGGFTFTAPTGSNQLNQIVGVVKVVDAADGEIEFFPGLGHWAKIGNDFLQDQAVGVNKLHNDARVNAIMTRIEELPAPTGSDQLDTDRFVFQCPANCEIIGASIISNTATSGSDETSEYTFELWNATQANSLSSVTVDTSDTEITADTPYALTIDQNTDVSNDDILVLRVDIEDDGTPNPTDLSSAVIFVELEYRVRA